MKKKGFLCILVGVLFYSLQLVADETGPATCGNAIQIVGSTSHYENPDGYTVTNATNNDFYKEEIYGEDFTINIKNLPEGDYTFEVYIAESYHESAGQRVFDILYNDSKIGENIDVFTEVGKDTEYLFSHTLSYVPSESGNELSIRFNAVKDNAKFNAIFLKDSNDSLVACGMAHEFTVAIDPLGTGNPFIQHIYTADPSAHEFEGKMFVYPSHDQTNATGFNMRDYHVFSSSDMKNWDDHGVVLDVDDVLWAKEYMWAPDCAYKNGTYYFYFPARNHDGEFKIGVATSSSPAGPFTPEAEPMDGSFSVDPAVFIDDDGQAYMYFGGAGDGGQTVPWIAKLDDSMKAFAEDPKAIEGTDHWFEACWMNKIGSTYYLSYSTGNFHPDYPDRSTIAYATSDNPYGPFFYQGVVNAYVSGWTNHHSIVDFKGQSYLFYHNSELSGGDTKKRSICADYLHFVDGEIIEVIQTEQGVGSYDGLKQIEAENYGETNGGIKASCDEGGECVQLKNNDTLIFNKVGFNDKSYAYLQLRIASDVDEGTIDIYAGKNLVGSVPVLKTGENLSWKTLVGQITAIKDTQDITLVLKDAGSSTVNLNWLQFTNSNGTSILGNPNEGKLNFYPNPVKDELNIKGINMIDFVEIIGMNGFLFIKENFTNSKGVSINIKSLDAGVYIVKVYSDNRVFEKKIVKQ